MVGIDHTDQRDAQFFGFQNRDFVETHVDHENSVWQCSHVLDAADVFFQLFDFALEGQLLFLADRIEASFLLGFHFFQALDRGLDRLEVGQHAAEPALVHVRDAGALGFSGDGFAGGALGPDHQDGAAVGGELLGELHRVLEHRQRFFQVDDVNTVAVAEDVWSHLGIPEAGLVTEVDAGFQHFTHVRGHNLTPKVGSKISAYRPEGLPGNTLNGRFAIEPCKRRIRHLQSPLSITFPSTASR